MKAGDAIVSGDPDRSQVVQFIEGRRGEEHRMPLGGAPLTAEQIALIRRWIAEGAKAAADSVVTYKLAIPNVRIRRSEGLQIECAVPTRAYLILSVRDSRRILFERRAVVRSPGEPVSWFVWPEKGWPGRSRSTWIFCMRNPSRKARGSKGEVKRQKESEVRSQNSAILTSDS